MSFYEDVGLFRVGSSGSLRGVLFASSSTLGWRRYLPRDEADLVLDDIARQADRKGVKDYSLSWVSYSDRFGYRVIATYDHFRTDEA